MEERQVDELIATGKPQTFKPLHELLDIPVETPEEAMKRMQRELREAIERQTKVG